MSIGAELRIPENLKVLNLSEKKPDIARKPAVFIRLLSTYLRHNKDYLEVFEALRIGGDMSSLREHVHTLKGASGNLGFYNLFECAAELESSLRLGQGVPEAVLQRFRATVADSFDDAERIIELNNSVSVEHPSTVSFVSLKEVLEEKLQNHSLVDSDLVYQFRSAASQHWPREKLTHFIEYLEQFDYDEALELLQGS